MRASLLSFEHLFLLLLGAVAGGKGIALVSSVQLRRLDVPQDEGTGVHVLAGTVGRAPPAADLVRVTSQYVVFQVGARASNLPPSCHQEA